jgi:hypothetical protein
VLVAPPVKAKENRRYGRRMEEKMKQIKIMGLCLVAALAVMALVGAASASAAETTLCKTEHANSVCPQAEHYNSGTSITGTNSGNAVLTTSGGFINPTVTCTKSTVGGKTTATGGNPLTGSITTFTFTGCSWSGGSCTVTSVNTPYSAGIEWTSGQDGTFTAGSSGKGEPGASVTCEGIALTCTYTKEVSLEAEGGKPAKIYAKNESLKISGGFGCPTEAHWTATYTVSPSPLYVEHS